MEKAKENRNREKIISALLEAGSVRGAAKISGVSEPTIFRCLKDTAFKREYQEARSRFFEAAIAGLQRICGDAVKVLEAIMNDNKRPTGPRVSAAKTVLDLAIKAAEIQDLQERIGVLEERIPTK